MTKNFDLISEKLQNRVLEIHEKQMAAFGGEKPEFELEEVFKRDNMLCVRFRNGDWYHYSLNDGTWF